ncbi:MAG TPA: ABC transporter ATP-binding protein [Acidimicrobiales bacterium]|nr:ABC transporter ATP-binding protein [Acidimicrobiales bacterium]
MTLDARVRCTLGSLHLDVTLQTPGGETIAVLGPNGAGKTTLFRCIAGLVPVDDGAIDLDGRCLDDPSRGVFVPPEDRPIGVVFQDYLLFPNLSALENVAFGLRARGMAKAEARRRASSWLATVGLADHADHRPSMLSGGQAQRIALARALATEPRVLLLDEPLAALDAGTKSDVRRDLRRHLASFEGVRLLVTHDPVDAYALADRVLIVESGRVVQQGTLEEVTTQPRSRYVADLVGVNLLRGVASRGTISTASGARVVSADVVDGPAFAVIAPHSVALYPAHPEGSPRNTWQAVVTDVDRLADRVRVRLVGEVPLVAEVTPGAVADLGLEPGVAVWATVKATEVTLYPA